MYMYFCYCCPAGLRSLALSPCCLRLQDGEARGSEDGPGGSQSGKKHAASTVMVQYAKRRRTSLSTAAHSSQVRGIIHLRRFLLRLPCLQTRQHLFTLPNSSAGDVLSINGNTDNVSIFQVS